MFRSKASNINSREAEDAIRRIGADLGRLRVKRGERLEDIADYLGIRSIYLYGIEQGDLSIIPSQQNVRSFTSSYANYLGLDGDAIMNRLAPVIRNLERAKAPSGTSRVAGLDRSTAIIFASSIALGIVAGWSYLGDVAKLDLIAPPVTAEAAGETDGSDFVAVEAAADTGDNSVDSLAIEAEQALAALEDQAAKAQNGGTAEPAAILDLDTEDGGASSPTAALDEQQAIAEEKALKQEIPANVLATLVAKRGDGAEIYEPENTDARVIVRALDTSWIQVSSRDRSYIWTRTMQPREMLLVPNRDDLELWAGDASGVELLLDGIVLPTLGPPGTVIRGVSLAPRSLAALSDTVSREASSKPTF